MNKHEANIEIYNYIQSRYPQFFEPLEEDSIPNKPVAPELQHSFRLTDNIIDYIMLELQLEIEAKNNSDKYSKYKSEMEYYNSVLSERKAAASRNKVRVHNMMMKHLNLWKLAGKFIKNSKSAGK